MTRAKTYCARRPGHPGKCIRGLLHTRCNSAVGIVETMGEMVAEYRAARAD